MIDSQSIVYIYIYIYIYILKYIQMKKPKVFRAYFYLLNHIPTLNVFKNFKKVFFLILVKHSLLFSFHLITHIA